MNLYHDQFSEEHDFPLVERPSKVLIIASTGRCGSHMLGHSLYKTNNFGFPLEYVNPANLAEWKKRLKTQNTVDTLRKIQCKRTSQNGVFSIKIHYSHIQQFGDFENIMRFFPEAYYVLLSRKNVLRQAISYSIASQTGVWINGQKPINNHPRYDFNHINHRLREVIRDNASWRYILAATGCNYIEMDFDFAKKDISNALKQIAEFMSIEVDPKIIPEQPVTKKQSNNMNLDWERRFLADYNGEVLTKTNKIGIRGALKKRLKNLLGVSRSR